MDLAVSRRELRRKRPLEFKSGISARFSQNPVFAE